MLAAPVVMAEGFERQLESHEHGKASMNVVLEGETLEIEIKTPAANIIGFEHAPETDQQRQTLGDAVARLKMPENFIVLPEDAACQLAVADVHSSLLGGDDDHDADHHDEDQHDEEHHSDFELSYQFHCQTPDVLHGFSLDLFQSYPLMKQLEVQSISPAGQNYQALNADNRWVNL